MNALTSCEHPKRIFNHVLNSWISVPCGKCPMCLNSHAALLNQRLDAEFACWKYCVFFTLTYSEDNLPRLELKKEKNDAGIYEFILKHKTRDFVDCSSGEFNRFDDLDDTCVPCPTDFWNEDSQYLFKFYGNTIPYCSTRDISLFIKRIRKNLYENEKIDTSFRYIVAGELGPDTYRPHFHGLLFFNSEYLGKSIGELLSEHWPFGDWFHGLCEWKFITDSCPHYVTSYIGCAHLYPSVYNCSKIRPRLQFSKSPALGTLAVPTEEIRKIFSSSSPIFLDNIKGVSASSDVPLWRVFQTRLFPRLPYFNRFPLESLRYYYAELRQISNGVSFKEFYRRLRKLAFECRSDFRDYILLVTKDFKQKYSCMAFYYAVKRIEVQSNVFGISFNQYLDRIFDFYSNKQKYSLNKQLQFERDFVQSYNVRFLVNIDQEFIRFCLCSLPNLSDFQVSALLSFGFGYDEIFNPELLKILLRKDYALHNTPTYKLKKDLHHSIIENSHKNRSKHERYGQSNNQSY